MFNKLKQFKDLRGRAKQLQEELSKESLEGTAGWGKVKVVINGNQSITDVVIDPTVMDDREKLQTMIKEAANDAITKMQKVMAQKIKDTGGLDLAQEFGDIMGKGKKQS